jgi:prepilin-type N-terminal cleavage/methylation domain-containing protein
MRKGVTLVELIFTIVIIAMVFTVVPKIIYAVNKSDSFTMRQDALMNGVSMLHMISNMPWDANDTNSSDILHVNSSANSAFDCDETTHYRRGGFIGSRNCEDNLSASDINNSLKNGNDIWALDNVGDFNNTDINITAYGSQIYELNITVDYIQDDNLSIKYSYSGNSATVDLNNSSSNYSTNLKQIEARVFYHGERGAPRELARFNYTSANIGLMIINKREWQ